MKVKSVGTAGGKTVRNLLTTFLIDEVIALDCGSVCTGLDLTAQLKIEDVFISHVHMDHVGELPLLVDNKAIYGKSLRVHATATTISHLKENIFNGIIWPDFTKIPSPETPALIFHEVNYYQESEIGRCNLTPLPVNHIDGSAGCYIECNGTGFAYTSDTGRTDAIWQWLNKQEKLKGLITECSFPSSMEQLAELSKHLTGKSLRDELKKLTRTPMVLIYHLKPQFADEIRNEIDGLNVHVLCDGEEFEF